MHIEYSTVVSLFVCPAARVIASAKGTIEYFLFAFSFPLDLHNGAGKVRKRIEWQVSG